MQDQSRFAFIVGAPRCGTTTLASFLQQHPDVCFSAVKEPHFFTQHDFSGRDEATTRQIVDEEYLQRFFGQCSNNEQLRAEGSVTYLYAPEKMEPILKLWPDARFIIALRDPLSMLPSLHARLLVTGDESVRDFPPPGHWSKSALAVARSPRAQLIPAGCVMTRLESWAAGSRLSSLRSGGSAAMSCCSMICLPTPAMPIATCAPSLESSPGMTPTSSHSGSTRLFASAGCNDC